MLSTERVYIVKTWRTYLICPQDFFFFFLLCKLKSGMRSLIKSFKIDESWFGILPIVRQCGKNFFFYEITLFSMEYNLVKFPFKLFLTFGLNWLFNVTRYWNLWNWGRFISIFAPKKVILLSQKRIFFLQNAIFLWV